MYSSSLVEKKAILELSPLNSLPLTPKSLHHPSRRVISVLQAGPLSRAALRSAEDTYRFSFKPVHTP